MADPDVPGAAGGVGGDVGADDEVHHQNEIVEIPFSAATSWKWEEAAMKEVTDKMSKKVRRLLNGRRVTVWRICVEKRRKYFADMLGLASGQLGILPPDCRKKIIDYLPHDPAGADDVFSCAELNKKAQQGRDAAARKWASIITTHLAESWSPSGHFITEGNGGSSHWVLLPRTEVNSENAGPTWRIAEACGEIENGAHEPDASGKRPMLQNCWWTLPELHRELRALGFEPEVLTGQNMLNGETEKTAKKLRLENPFVLQLMEKTQ